MMNLKQRTWLVEKRENKNLTQEAVANAAGVSRTTYASIEQGYRTPSVVTAKKIAKVLKMEWTIFFEN